MRIIDRKFADNKLHYVLQCALATVAVLVILIILDALSNAAIIAALGASCFIAFTMPQAQVSRPRFMIGGYLVGCGVGSGCFYLTRIPWPEALGPAIGPYVVFGALAVGLAIFVMVVTNTEHPPAASLALGLVLAKSWHVRTVIVVLVGIVLVALLKRALRPFLKNLL